ncbi:hypothetical protein K2Y00_03185 [Patescibacteria group bacterium]|nr:hypothetical protein [Patescibacteria group bacterium]
MKLKVIPIIIASISTLFAVYSIWPEWFGFCQTHDRGDGVTVCASPLWYPYAAALLSLSATLLTFSILAFFSSPKTYRRWIVFSVVYGVIVSILMITIPELGYGMGGFGFTLLDTRGFAVLYSALYGLLALALLGASELIERSERNT